MKTCGKCDKKQHVGDRASCYFCGHKVLLEEKQTTPVSLEPVVAVKHMEVLICSPDPAKIPCSMSDDDPVPYDDHYPGGFSYQLRIFRTLSPTVFPFVFGLKGSLIDIFSFGHSRWNLTSPLLILTRIVTS
jgi:DNA-directed RNA polymerase subunit RPC12/RpoP